MCPRGLIKKKKLSFLHPVHEGVVGFFAVPDVVVSRRSRDKVLKIIDGHLLTKGGKPITCTALRRRGINRVLDLILSNCQISFKHQLAEPECLVVCELSTDSGNIAKLNKHCRKTRKLSSRYLRLVLEAMKAEGLLVVRKGYSISYKKPSADTQFCTFFYPTIKLSHLLGTSSHAVETEALFEDLFEAAEPEAPKARSGQLLVTKGFKPTRAFKSEREQFVRRMRDNLRKHSYNFLVSVEKGEYFVKALARSSVFKNTSLREANGFVIGDIDARLFSDFWQVYQKDTKNNGRYHANAQSMPSEIRKFLYVDRKPLTDLDFSAMFVVLVYHAFMKKKVLSPPYELVDLGWDNKWFMRKVVKLLINIMLNAKDMTEAESSMRERFVKDGRWFRTWEHQHTPAMPGVGPYTKHIRYAITRIRETLPELEPYWFQGLGPQLMNIESNIATHVISHFLDLDEWLFPMHDGFLVKRHMALECERVMREAYLTVTGFEPVGIKVNVFKYPLRALSRSALMREAERIQHEELGETSV